MAVTANQIVKRAGRDGNIRSLPVAANAVIYEGTMVFEDAGGDFAGTVVELGVFGGIACEYVDNTGGADAAKYVDVWVDGEFDLPMSSASLVAADMGKPVYGVDNYAVSETATDLVPVGIITKVLSTSLARVSIHGCGQPEAGARAT